jgi:hypothetical protein
MNTLRTHWAALLAASLLMTACTTTGDESVTLEWSFTGLEPLGEGSVYEGWIIVDGEPVSTGRFDVDDQGVPTLEFSSVSMTEAETATDFVLSIEPDPDDSLMPADTKILGGSFDVDGMADLGIDHGAALGQDFAMAAGSYILNTPTTAADDSDYDQGIWWLTMPGPAASLDLPTLPAGWAYEGWVVVGGMPTTTGRFTQADMDDDDAAGPTAGMDGFPPFPGQDFIDPALDLVGGAAVISVEPEPDDSPMPFVLKPLLDGEISDEGLGGAQDMANNAASTNPTGSASFSTE